ncbi:MAG: hypothetical protein DRQ88_01800 [Epsilonproteobacteria bacterium]|nr:MAG: hypothetical protein DRQ89_08665 [Campylobacterota bacterium]RLA67811.1 MAG: hypothetical protein DRQ88_01800 [Campylobacterota bacterium]
MNKNIYLVVIILLLSFLGYFLYTNPLPRLDVSFQESKDRANLPPPAPIVKDIQLDSLIVRETKEDKIKKELKIAKERVESRDDACKKNSQDIFLGSLKGDIVDDLNLVFKRSLNRKEAEQAFLKIQEILNSKIPINLNIFYSLLFSLDICRPRKSMEFLDRVIGSLKDSDDKYQEKLVPVLLSNINNNLLGNNYAPINLSLIFGKLGKLIEMKVIKEPFAGEILNLKAHFLTYEREANRNIKRAEGQEQLRDLTIEHFSELKEISIELKSILSNI